MRRITATFFKGLAAVLPLAITIYTIYWLATACEGAMAKLLKAILPDTTLYFPGFGTLVGLALIFLIGFILNAWMARKIFGWFESLLARLPLVQTIYGSVKDLLGFLVGSKDKKSNQVVTITFGDPGLRLVGFITREDFGDLPEGIGDQGMVAVYLPMSYQLGGFTVMVQRSTVNPVDMTTEQALRFCVTAGMTTSKRDETNS